MIKQGRRIIGATNPLDADPGTLFNGYLCKVLFEVNTVFRLEGILFTEVILLILLLLRFRFGLRTRN